MGAAVDIFVWGSLVTYAGTGRRPFGQGTVVEIVYRLRHEPPDLEGLEGRLREMVEGCMAKQPEPRPTAKALLLALLGDHADPDPQASVTQLLEQTCHRRRTRSSRRRLLCRHRLRHRRRAGPGGGGGSADGWLCSGWSP